LSPDIYLGKEDNIAHKGPSINTEQGKISGERRSTGNKGYIADKQRPQYRARYNFR
jgi:hypothetical protein